MCRFIPYVFKSLWRHRTRSLLTLSGAAVALFVFCGVAAVQEGLYRLVKDPESDRRLIVFQENRFCPTTSRLPQDYARSIAMIDGVAEVVPIQLVTNNCRASLDVVVFEGMPADKIRQFRDLQLDAGPWNEFRSRRDGALVGRSVARRRQLQAGSQFTLGEISVRVAGVFASTVPAEENLIFAHLEYLQRAPGVDAVGTVTQFEVRVAETAEPDTVAAAIDEQLHSGPVATVTRRKGAFQSGSLADLLDLVEFSHWLGYASIGLVLSLVMTTTVMAVQDRVRQYAVMQTLGFRPGRIFRLVVSESILLCLAGGLIGTAAALGVLASDRFAIGAEAVTIAFRPSWRLAAAGLGISLAVGLAAGLAPAWQAARQEIAVALRNE